MSEDEHRTSAWAPLRQPLFRALWTAGVVSNVGTWMHGVGGTWLMTLLTASPLLVALMQTATSLPVFLVGLPAGALADIVDRRRLLLGTQLWMLAVAAALCGMTFTGAMTPWGLLALTFALGVGSALNAPAWQAITPELVPREMLAPAVTLSGVSVNIARAIGPALGGLIVAVAGPGWVFLLNALSFVGVLVVIYRWRRVPPKRRLPAENMVGAMRAGWRYVRHSEPLRAALVRAVAFVSCASALWALIPLVARRELQLGSAGYGVLLGCLGVGALVGAAILPRLRVHLSPNALVAAATGMFAAATAALGLLHYLGAMCAFMIVGGVAWIAMMSSLNVASLASAPRWVQARSVGMYMLAFQGSMAAASVGWGVMAGRFGNSATLLCAAAGLVVGLAVTARWPLKGDVMTDLSPSLHWPEPAVVTHPPHDDGPVMVLTEYRIDPERADDFVRVMAEVRRERMRDGALRCDLFRDPTEPGRYVETFYVESWVEHLRQHERVTVADRAVQDQAIAFHIGEQPPIVSHFIAEHEPGRR